MTAAECRERGAEAMCRAQGPHWPGLWRQAADTWYRLAELADERERQREREALARWWKPWTW